jgi:predicted ATP-grasp superfamily ATP-dependent carboligase
VAQVEDDATTCGSTQAALNLQKVINDLVSGQRILTESLQKQQDLLTNHIEQQHRATRRNERAIAELRAGKREPQDRKRLECYGCSQGT